MEAGAGIEPANRGFADLGAVFKKKLISIGKRRKKSELRGGLNGIL